MALRELLVERRTALCQRWFEAVVGEYGEVTATRWRKVQDQFANPIGHALSTGLPELLAVVLAGGEPGPKALAALEGIVRIRSIHDLTPSRAVAFPYHLRRAIREELAAELANGAFSEELARIDARIEQLALLAFDAYVALREQMFRLRQEELKRSVASILRRWNGGEVPDEASEDFVRLTPPKNHGEWR
jgi:hypothetical protein